MCAKKSKKANKTHILFKSSVFYFFEFGVDGMLKRREGRPLPDTPAMKMWRKEYEQMSLEEHQAKLRELGLSDEDFNEFKEVLKQEKKRK